MSEKELSDRELIKEIFKHLTKEQSEKLKSAHKYEISCYVPLPNKRFIGCHIVGVPTLVVEHYYNNWSIGYIL